MSAREAAVESQDDLTLLVSLTVNITGVSLIDPPKLRA